MIVVDTNILVNHLWSQEEVVRVRRRDSHWTAPLIAASELRNALLGFARQGRTTADEAKRMNTDALAALGSGLRSVADDATLDVALECGLTAYDAGFVVCARALGRPARHDGQGDSARRARRCCSALNVRATLTPPFRIPPV